MLRHWNLARYKSPFGLTGEIKSFLDHLRETDKTFRSNDLQNKEFADYIQLTKRLMVIKADELLNSGDKLLSRIILSYPESFQQYLKKSESIRIPVSAKNPQSLLS